MLLNPIIALAALATTVSAQTNATSIDPTTVTAQLRASWCNGQQNGCTILCGGIASTNVNRCSADDLSWTCTCNNGSTPDIADYIDTMPYYICEQSYDLCIAAHPNDQLGQDGCQTNIRAKCGTLNLANVTVSSTSASSAPSSTAASSATSAAGASTSASPSPTHNAAAALSLGRDFGTGILAAGVVGAFGLLL